MADKKRIARGRAPTKPQTPYQLAKAYERTLADLDRREAQLRADRERLEVETPAAVRQMAALSMKVKRTQPELPAPAPVLPAPAVQAKSNGKPNGNAVSAQA